MPPQLRGKPYHEPPRSPLNNKEATTRRRTHYFNAFDRRTPGTSASAVAKECGITESCGRYWRKQREAMGFLAKRQTRQRSQKLGMPSQVTKGMCQKLVDPAQNPVRFARVDAQIQHHQIPVQRRQLSCKLKEHTNQGQIYKCAFIQKEISAKNTQEREEYGSIHEDKPLIGFWDYIVFTDEAHVDPLSMFTQGVLRETGGRYKDENIVEKPARTRVKFHMAGWVS